MKQRVYNTYEAAITTWRRNISVMLVPIVVDTALVLLVVRKKNVEEGYETNAATVNKKIDIKCGVRPEHEIMHSIFENSVHYRNTVFPQFKIIPSITVEDITCLYTTCWSNESAKSILNALQKLAYCHLNESELELSYCVDILHSCTEKWKTWNNEQILKLMQSLIVLHKPLACVNNYEAFIKKLNNECLKRFYSSNTEQLLLLSDAFYQLNNITSDYMWRALRKLGTKPHKLSAKSLVHFLFLVTVPYIKIPINMFEIECHLINCLDELTVDEIGIVAKGFFLYKKHIQNKQLASAIIQILIKYSKTINSNSLGSVMKLLRYSGSNHDVILFQKLLEVLCKEIPRLQLPCLTAIAHATAGLRLYDEILINNIYKSLGNTLHSSRIKDIERILFALCTITPETDYYVAACNKIINHIMLTYTTYKAPEIHK
ncbi:FAST kinase domain-containing protein 5 [Eufriesea mexicana]|nr:FAST kinase domain-containing protein 5 [Eufriesea mexicana]